MRNFGIPRQPTELSDLRDEYDYESEQAREWLTLADLWPELLRLGLVSVAVMCISGLVVAVFGG